MAKLGVGLLRELGKQEYGFPFTLERVKEMVMFALRFRTSVVQPKEEN